MKNWTLRPSLMNNLDDVGDLQDKVELFSIELYLHLGQHLEKLKEDHESGKNEGTG